MARKKSKTKSRKSKSKSYRKKTYSKKTKSRGKKSGSRPRKSSPYRTSGSCRSMSRNTCNTALGSGNLRRCRWSFSNNHCEMLPAKYRRRATLQVGGSARHVKYKPGARRKISIPSGIANFNPNSGGSYAGKYNAPARRKIAIPAGLGMSYY